MLIYELMKFSAKSSVKTGLFLVLSAVVGALAVAGIFGPNILNPLDTGWLNGGDAFFHYLGWLHFKNGPWVLPPGKIQNFLYPVGTTLMQTDSITSVAIPLKLIFGGGINFQYFGGWVVFCYSAMFYFGFKISRLLGLARDSSFLAALIVTISPVLIYRMMHMSLCFQACVLMGIYGYLLLAKFKVRQPSLFYWSFTFAFLMGVHPYLVVMFFGFFVATYWLYLRQVGFKRARAQLILQFIILSTVSGVLGWAYGYFGVKDATELGFGGYSSDLLALFNPRTTSQILPHLRSGWGQYEGYGYFGLGMLLLMFFGLAHYFNKKHQAKFKHRLDLLPLKIILVGFILFNLSSPITFGGNPIIYYDWFFNLLQPFPSIFRASGRFIYPFYFTLFFFVIWMGHRIFKNKLSYVLALVLAIQIYDFVWPMRSWKHDLSPGPLVSTFWDSLQGKYEQMVMVPSQMLRKHYQCVEDGFHHDLLPYFILKAGNNGLPINSGYTSRSGPDIDELCDNFWVRLPQELQKKYLWVIHPQYEGQWKQALATTKVNLQCQVVDSYQVCAHQF